jgi:hypothetical protein
MEALEQAGDFARAVAAGEGAQSRGA